MMQVLANCLRFKKSNQAKYSALYKEVHFGLNWIHSVDQDIFIIWIFPGSYYIAVL